MAQTIEKQPFCNICADLEINLDSLDSRELKLSVQEEIIASRSEKKISKLLRKLVRKSENNSYYMNETYAVNDYKSNIDRKYFFKIPIAL